MPRGVKTISGKHLGGNNALCPYEYIFPTSAGPPDFSPGSTDKRKIMLYAHGGAFVFGTRGSHRQLLCTMVKEIGISKTKKIEIEL